MGDLRVSVNVLKNVFRFVFLVNSVGVEKSFFRNIVRVSGKSSF